MNDKRHPRFHVQPDKTYLLRLINMSGFAQFCVQIDGHNFTIIEADGVNTKRYPVENLYIATGQRYGALLKTKPTSLQNYAIQGAMDVNDFDSPARPPAPNVTGALVYDGISLYPQGYVRIR